MDYVGKLKVIPELPQEISRLKDLAYNLYFSWNPESRQLFRLLDKELWKKVNHNPVKFLQEIQQKNLEKFANDPAYLSMFKKIIVEFDQYMSPKETWFSKNFPEHRNKHIAYFSAEFGLHESLPIYAGGLGVLAGDHLKSASDLGIPIVGVSLFYFQTYFTQQIDAFGHQIANYEPVVPDESPLLPVLDASGNPLYLDIPVGPRNVKIRIWKAQIGRITAFLLDANVPENTPEDRLLTARLYGGDQEMRISQEIILGMGGVRALDAMGYEISAWHMNEGHSVFLALERIRDLMQNHRLSFSEALETVSANTIFTTHTPVPAGNDAFPLHIKDKYFRQYWESVGIRRHQFMELGSQVQPEGYEIFNLTILSLNLSRFRNGVSKLHAEVSRRLWKDAWPDVLPEEVPISHITNGVHTMTWTVRRMRELYDKFLGPQWREHQDDPLFWKSVYEIPNNELWMAKKEVKEKMLNHLRERLHFQFSRNKVGTLHIHRLKKMLHPDILTIGFARRFATYKRGSLVFRDPERLKRILNNPDRPVQIIFAGKAHPKDKGGQELIRAIYNYSMQDGFRGKIFFVEGYDMHLARDLVSGVDVWLNNPVRTQEASGTSGQKVCMNGGINFSVLDGWWVEGYKENNGWAFGDQGDVNNMDELNYIDSEAIYELLESEIIPLYYQRDENGLPNEWIQIMKNSMSTIIPYFNTERMVKEYVNQMYIPAIQSGEKFSVNNFEIAKNFTAWRDKVENNWSQISLELNSNSFNSELLVLKYKEPFKLNARVYLGTLQPEQVKVQVVLVQENDGLDSETYNFEVVNMKKKKRIEDNTYLYEAVIIPSNSGNYRFTLRILPDHPHQNNQVELGLARWLQQVD